MLKSHLSVAALARIASVNLASLASILSVTLASGAAVPARADLIICNQSDEDVSIATMYHRSSNDAWTASGWYNLDDNDCNQRLSFDLNETVYFHARVGGINGRTTHPGSSAQSTTSFCVDTEDPFETVWDGDNNVPWYKDVRNNLSDGFERCEDIHPDFAEVSFRKLIHSKNYDHCVVALGKNGSLSYLCFD